MANNDTNNYQPPSPSDESLGMSLQDKGKQYSVESVKTLDHIQDLKQTYQSLLHQAEQIHKSTDVENYTSVSRSKSQLAQLLGSIEKLQFSQLDAVSTMHLSSGKSDAKSTRRELNTALDELQEFITSLYERYEALPRPLPAASSVSETEGGTKTQDDREEETSSERKGVDQDDARVSDEEDDDEEENEEEEDGEEEDEEEEQEAMHKEALRQLMSQAVNERTAHAQHQQRQQQHQHLRQQQQQQQYYHRYQQQQQQQQLQEQRQQHLQQQYQQQQRRQQQQQQQFQYQQLLQQQQQQQQQYQRGGSRMSAEDRLFGGFFL